MTDDEAESTSLSGKVARWLGAHGYPLEMRTADVLASSGLSVHPAWYYEDVDTGQQRETDVMAVARSKSGLTIRLAVECKATPDKPWVLFVHKASDIHPKAMAAQRFVSPTKSPFWKYVFETPELRELPLLQAHGRPGYSLIKVSFGSSTNEDPSYSALMSCLKAAAGIHEWVRRAHRQDDGNAPSLVLPVLVLDAPLFACRLGEDDQVQLEQIDRATLLWKYQLAGRYSPTSIISVVTTSALPALTVEVSEAVAALESAYGTLNRQGPIGIGASERADAD